MTMDKCCICLEYTSRKVCDICEGKAHLSCWGHFLKEHNKIEYEVVEMESGGLCHTLTQPAYVHCPWCRSKISQVGIITRSSTLHIREQMLIAHVGGVLDDYDDYPHETIKSMFYVINNWYYMFGNMELLSVVLQSFLKEIEKTYPEYHSSVLYYKKLIT